MERQVEQIKDLISCIIQHGWDSQGYLDIKQDMVQEYGYKRWVKIIEYIAPIAINEKRRLEKDL